VTRASERVAIAMVARRWGSWLVCLGLAPLFLSLLPAFAYSQSRLTIDAHARGVYGLAFSPDGTLLASVGCEDVKDSASVVLVKVWDAKTGKKVAEITPSHLSESPCIAFAADGKFLLLTCFRTSGEGLPRPLRASNRLLGIEVWDLASKALRRTIEFREGEGACWVLSPNGKTVSVSSSPSGFNRYDVASGRESGPIVIPVRATVAFVASGDQRTMATVGGRRREEVWVFGENVGRPFHVEMPVDDPTVSGLALSPDGRTLAVNCK
jgi:WD40 repeat protein